MIRNAGRSRWMLVFLIVILAGCATGDGATYETRDSAGIRIVESARGAWTDATRWRIDSVPSLDIGGGDSADAYLLHRVVTARVLSGGRVAVANTGTAEVRIFDSAGRHLSTVGRRGQGPGELAPRGTCERCPEIRSLSSTCAVSGSMSSARTAPTPARTRHR